MENLFFYLFKKITDENTYWRYYFDFQSKKNKFEIINSNISNENQLLSIFCDVQKIYHGFARLAHLFIQKKAVIQNTTDLGLNPISLSSRTTHTFLQGNSRFCLTISEIIQTVNSALSYVNGFFILQNSIPKNPYTNVPLTKSILYNMYFAVKSSDFKMSPLFHAFFMHHFDLTEFNAANNAQLIDYAISKYAYQTHFNILYPEVMVMINCHVMMQKLYIDPLFPKDILVNTMRPFLYLTLRLEYSAICHHEWNKIRTKWNNALDVFYTYNPKFGRRYIRYKNKKQTISFDTNCLVDINKKPPTLAMSF